MPAGPEFERQFAAHCPVSIEKEISLKVFVVALLVLCGCVGERPSLAPESLAAPTSQTVTFMVSESECAAPCRVKVVSPVASSVVLFGPDGAGGLIGAGSQSAVGFDGYGLYRATFGLGLDDELEWSWSPTTDDVTPPSSTVVAASSVPSTSTTVVAVPGGVLDVVADPVLCAVLCKVEVVSGDGVEWSWVQQPRQVVHTPVMSAGDRVSLLVSAGDPTTIGVSFVAVREVSGELVLPAPCAALCLAQGEWPGLLAVNFFSANGGVPVFDDGMMYVAKDVGSFRVTTGGAAVPVHALVAAESASGVDDVVVTGIAVTRVVRTFEVEESSCADGCTVTVELDGALNPFAWSFVGSPEHAYVDGTGRAGGRTVSSSSEVATMPMEVPGPGLLTVITFWASDSPPAGFEFTVVAS